MIQAFPELQELFRLETFDHKRLEDCIELINSIYPEKDKNKMAHSLLRMELLKYQLSGGKKKWIIKSRKVYTHNAILKSLNGVNKKADLRDFRFKKEPGNKKSWVFFVNKKVSEVAQKLDISLDFLLRYFKKNGIKLTPDHRLMYDELSEIQDYIVNRLDILERLKKNKSHKRIRLTRKNSISAFKGAWGQMRKYGSPGKIIYIRSR